MGIDLFNTILISVLCGLYSGVIVARRSIFDQIKTDIVSSLQTFYKSKLDPDSVEVIFVKLSEAENKFRYLGHFEAIRSIWEIQSQIRKSLSESRDKELTAKEAAVSAWNEMVNTVEMGINVKPSIFILYLPFPYRRIFKYWNSIKINKFINKKRD